MSTEETQAAAPVDTNTTTTSTETAEPSLSEEIGAHFELAEKGEEAPDLSAAARTLAGARKSARAAEATTTQAATSTTTAATGAATTAAAAEVKTDDATKTADAAVPVEAPAHWPAAAREMFAKQSPEVKAWLLDRHKAMEGDYTKKTQELAPTRRLQEDLDEIFKDYDAEMKQIGVSRAQAIRELVGMHTRWKTNPAEYIKYVAGISKIDLKSLVEGAAAADPAGESPTVKALRDQVAELTGQIKTMSGAQRDQQQNARMNEVTQFAEEKDAQGNLKRPYFDEVASDVAALIRASKGEDGRTTLSLQDAYDRAIYANPTTRQKLLTAQDAERKTKEEAERKAKADAAKKAGFDVKGEGAATAVAATTGTVRDDLSAAMSAWEGRV